MPEYKRAIGLEPNCKTAIFVGRLVPEKGVDVWLKIWKEVVAGLPKALLFIIGDGPLENELRESVERLGISGCVRFAGFQEDIRQFLFAMEAFLLFSPNEGMSNALLEAMAENPGTSAIIQHMVNGVKLQAERISEAAANVRRILADPALAATISERARADVRAQFDISVTPGNMSSFF
jgi:glycosyltransferase involved in cell wall biosynthesis